VQKYHHEQQYIRDNCSIQSNNVQTGVMHQNWFVEDVVQTLFKTRAEHETITHINFTTYVV